MVQFTQEPTRKSIKMASLPQEASLEEGRGTGLVAREVEEVKIRAQGRFQEVSASSKKEKIRSS